MIRGERSGLATVAVSAGRGAGVVTTATDERTIRKVTRPTIRRCFRCAAPRASYQCLEGRKVVAYACPWCAAKWERGEA